MRLFIAVLLGATLLAGCREQETTPTATDADLSLPADQVIYGLEHAMTANGIRKAVVHGDTAYVNGQGSQLDVMGVKIDFFDETGRPSGNLTSNTGAYDTQGGTMVARGNVVLITSGPTGKRRLESEELHFDVNGDRIWSTKPFVLRDGGRITRGASFRSDTRFENLSIDQARTEGGLPAGGIRF